MQNMKVRKFRLQKVLPKIEPSLVTLDKEEGEVQDHVEEPVPTQKDKAEEEPRIPFTPIDEAIDHYHRHIPSSSLKTWHGRP